MLMAVVYVLVLLVIFYLLAKICEEYFVDSLDIMGKKMKLPDDVTGATLMAVGSSAPELFTSLIAIYIGSSDIGSGTILGSAVFNILVIIGASAIVTTAALKWRPVVRDLGFYCYSIILLYFTMRDGQISLFEAWLFVGSYLGYIFLLVWWSRKFPSPVEEIMEKIPQENKIADKVHEGNKALGWMFKIIDNFFDAVFPNLTKNPHLYWLSFILSLAWIGFLSWAMVESAVNLATILQVPEAIIGLTILAGGTSVPDLLSSMIVAKQGRGDMAVSNAAGSNIFNILIALGLPWILIISQTGQNISVNTDNFSTSIILLFLTVVSIIILFAINNFRIGKKSGFILIGLYLLYLGYNIFSVF
jgi:K+-dependent Na+/Ca+ exchanger-like protein